MATLGQAHFGTGTTYAFWHVLGQVWFLSLMDS